MSLCDRCKNKCKFMLKNKTLDTCSLFEKYTNFDRITASTEALAKLMQNCVNCDDCPITDKSVCKYKYENCKEACVEWLKQESKE